MNPLNENNNETAASGDNKSLKDEYPKSLNPFGDEEDVDISNTTADKEKQSKYPDKDKQIEYPGDLNPFGDDDGGGLNLLKRINIRIAGHLASDLHYWMQHYEALAQTCYSHSEAMKTVLDKNEEYIDRMKATSFSGTGERKLFREMDIIQERLQHKSDILKQNADKYLEFAQELKSYIDDDPKTIKKLDNKYKQARDKLEKQNNVVDEYRQAYHRAMRNHEKAEIKAIIKEKDERRMKLIETLQEKAVKQHCTYKEALQKWQIKLERAQEISVQLQEAYITREVSRAEIVLDCLQRHIQMATSQGEADGLPMGVEAWDLQNIRSLIENVCSLENIGTPVLQEYKRGNTKLDIHANRDHVDRATVDLDVLQGPRVIHVVKKPYASSEINKLELKNGDRIKQLVPVNEDGFSYGEVNRGLFRRKKRGFYPVANV